MTDIEQIAQALVIRPGQKLLLRVADPRLTDKEASLLKERAEAALPGVEVFILVGIDEMAAFNPAPAS